MSELTDAPLDNCDCCEPEAAPAPLYNRPALPALSYRSGIHATIFRRMLSRLGTLTLPDGDFGGTRPLTSLTTRLNDDPAIALLDSYAVMLDVLTFYQERIANEGFLRTATERRSILELARAIGYELNPGVAAAVYLSFTVEDAPGAPGSAEIPAGMKVQSIPPQGGFPQTFETSEMIPARSEWNAILPRLSETQNLTTGISELYLNGTSANLKIGDVVLVTSTVYCGAAHIRAVDVDNAKKLTHLIFDTPIPALGGVPGALSSTVWGGQKIPFNAETVFENILQKTWTDSQLNAFLRKNEWDPETLVDYLNKRRAGTPAAIGYAFALRTRTGIFGNNAPKYNSLPVSQRFGEWVFSDPADQNKKQFKAAAYPASWENRGITTDSQGVDHPNADFFLERSLPAVLAGSYLALESKAGGINAYQVSAVIEKSLSDFAISGKATGITVTAGGGLNGYTVRDTTAYVQSEPLMPAGRSLTSDLTNGTTQLDLDGFFFGLRIGQAVALSGERADARGLLQNEILFIREIEHNYGLTRLTFESGLAYSYQRDRVTLNANVAPATHGETVSEILGNGSGAQSNQKFSLRKPPLTYTAAPTPGGSAATLQLRVNNLLWDEAPSLYGLSARDQNYTVRIDDDGKANIIFGDGEQGARLPTGSNNVVATYRSGTGLEGEVPAGSLTILQSRPLGVKGVTNPLAAGGAGDPEKMENARDHAPLTVRTLDHIVSREDYEDFASAFAGIGKAQSIDLWSGEQHFVHLTIAGEDAAPVTDAKFLKNFLAALNAVRDPVQRVRVDTYSQLLFNLNVNVAVDFRYITRDVFAAIESALAKEFAFERRAFGQPVTAAEVSTVIQNTAGVIYVDIDALYFSSQDKSLNQVLSANIAHVKNKIIQPAQLLLINTFGISLQEVKA